MKKLSNRTKIMLAAAKRRAAKPAKFVQLLSTDSPAGTGATWLLALDEHGETWIYLGFQRGWKKMNNRRMSDAEARRDDAQFLARSRRVVPEPKNDAY